MNSSVLSGKVKCVENPPQKTGAERGRNFVVWLQDTKKADGIQGNLTENPREKQQNCRFAKYANFLLFGVSFGWMAGRFGGRSCAGKYRRLFVRRKTPCTVQERCRVLQGI
ncbi:MAG: hypothetical protein ACLSS9_02410 [Acutalibacteraceae bacterium]